MTVYRHWVISCDTFTILVQDVSRRETETRLWEPVRLFLLSPSTPTVKLAFQPLPTSLLTAPAQPPPISIAGTGILSADAREAG